MMQRARHTGRMAILGEKSPSVVTVLALSSSSSCIVNVINNILLKNVFLSRLLRNLFHGSFCIHFINRERKSLFRNNKNIFNKKHKDFKLVMSNDVSFKYALSSHLI